MSSLTAVVFITLALLPFTAFKPACATGIYRCVSDTGAVSFSDRSCQQVAQQRIKVEPMPIVGWDKVEPVPRKKNSRRHNRTRQTDANKLADNTSKCHKTRSRIEKINNKLRAGYTLKAGERLKENLRELESFRFRNCR